MQQSEESCTLKTTDIFCFTLEKPVSYSGIGVHTGVDVELTLRPAPVGTGIVFRRVDLPNQPQIPATLDFVKDTNRCTTIGLTGKDQQHIEVKTVEHVMSALYATGIANAYVDVTGQEPPVGDGSAQPFIEMIQQAGVVQQEKLHRYTVDNPVYWSCGQTHLVGLPSDCFRISCTLSYPKSPLLKAQYQSFVITEEVFKKELAPCRTFSLYEEISPLLDRGLIKGGSLSNSVVIKGDAVISKDGLHFSDEMVRHKVLDLVGDLSLIGASLAVHVIAIRSGHHANYEFAKELKENLRRE